MSPVHVPCDTVSTEALIQDDSPVTLARAKPRSHVVYAVRQCVCGCRFPRGGGQMLQSVQPVRSVHWPLWPQPLDRPLLQV